MSNDQDIFDERLREFAENSEPQVGTSAWNRIESSLVRQRRRAVFFWSLLSLSLITAIVYLSLPMISSDQVVVDGYESNDVQQIESKTESSDEISSEETKSLDESFIDDETTIDPNERITAERSDRIVIPDTKVDPSTEARSSQDDITPEKVEQTPQSEVDDEKEIEEKSTEEEREEIAADDAAQNDQDIDKDISDAAAKNSKKVPTKSMLEKPDSSIASMKRWELGLSASPGLVARLVDVNNDFGWLVHREYLGIVDQQELASFSYQLDLLLRRFVTDKLYLSTGLNYINRGQVLRYNYEIDELVVVRHTEQRIEYDPLPPALRKEVKYDGFNNYHLAQIPLRIGIITPMNDKLAWSIEGGVAYNYLLGARGKIADPTYLELRDVDVNSLERNQVSASLKAGFERSLNSRNTILFNAIYNRDISSNRAKETGLDEKAFNYGVTIGWSHKLSAKK